MTKADNYKVARVLKTDGVFLLKTHAPAFYLALLKDRLKTFNPKKPCIS